MPVVRAAGALGALCATVACGGATIETRSLDASMAGADAASQSGDVESTPDAALDTGGDGGSVGLDSGPDATDLDAAATDPPPLACDADAGGEARLCPPPPSVCADTSTLVYYDNGQCVSGQCTWDKRSVRCSLPNVCWIDGCQGLPSQ